MGGGTGGGIITGGGTGGGNTGGGSGGGTGGGATGGGGGDVGGGAGGGTGGGGDVGGGAGGGTGGGTTGGGTGGGTTGGGTGGGAGCAGAACLPTLLKDIAAGDDPLPDSTPTRITLAGAPGVATTFYFVATTDLEGAGLWKSDGTAAGTQKVFSRFSAPLMASAFGSMAWVPGSNTLYFALNDGLHGSELWKTDGTPAGTSMLTDLVPGANGSNPSNFAAAGSKLFFSAVDASDANKIKLWVTDGTPTGTIVLPAENPSSVVELNGNVVFRANIPAGTTIPLWKSDGTVAGTAAVGKTGPALMAGESYSVSGLYSYMGKAYFLFGVTSGTFVSSTTAQRAIYVTDSTVAGTIAIKTGLVNTSFSLIGGSNVTDPVEFEGVGTQVFFTCGTAAEGNELFKTNGTLAGTSLVKDTVAGAASGSPQGLTAVNNQLYFSGLTGTDRELWLSDGTNAGTALLKNINTGTASSNPSNITSINGKVMFTAETAAAGIELWESNGTSAGTVLVKDVLPGNPAMPTGGSSINSLNNVAGTLVFSANDGVSGQELWSSIANTTTLLVNLNSARKGSNPGQYVSFNARVFFAAGDSPNGSSTNRELWMTDGTTAGTQLFKDINPGTADSNPTSLTVIDSTLYFAAADATTGAELWTSNGTLPGTAQLKDIRPGTMGSNPANFIKVGTTIFFTADDGTSGIELWKTDGTAAGTVRVKDINAGVAASTPTQLMDFGGTLFFVASDSSGGNELWKSDGTDTGTVRVKDIYPGTLSSNPTQFIVFNGVLYFAATDAATGNELWKSDGTGAGTVQVRDVNAGAANSDPTQLIIFNSALYFTATTAANGVELWKTDGTSGGTGLLKDINANAMDSSSPTQFVISGSTMFFTANNGTAGVELWKTQGNTADTLLVKDINTVGGASTSSTPSFLVDNNGTLLFLANDGVKGLELWKSDGTAAGTTMVKDIWVGDWTGTMSLQKVQGANKVLLTASDAVAGFEMWMTDGSAAGTTQFFNFAAGAQSPLIGGAISVAGRVYVTVDEGINGNEPWIFPVSALQ